MTHMNEYLPERLAANPLQAMESDSDIEAIADAVISASVLRDECDGDAAFKNSARQLLYACLGYLRDWCSLPLSLPPPSVTLANQPPCLPHRPHRNRHPSLLPPCLSFRSSMEKGAAPKRVPFRASWSLRHKS